MLQAMINIDSLMRRRLCDKLHAGIRTAAVIDRQPAISRQSRFVPTPPAFDAPVRAPVGILPRRLVRKKTRMMWLPDDEKN